MSYIVHKCVEIENVKKSLRPTEEQLLRDYLLQDKYDGCAMVAIRDSDGVKLLSRTGEAVVSARHIEAALMQLPEGVYLGEYWQQDVPQNVLSGQFRKQDGAQYPGTNLVIFDYLTSEEWAAGCSDLGYTQRHSRIPRTLQPSFAHTLYVAAAMSASGYESLAEVVKSRTNPGYDGVIFRHPDGKWRRGDNGTNGEIIKIKPVLSLDLRVVRHEMSFGGKTGRTVYKIVVALGNGKKQTVGSGVPHRWEDVPKIGDIVEVEAMSMSAHGLLREPRFKAIRFDKVESDR
ncbi:ATP-dependent DNA ligase [Xanthomonas oryzae]|uniref:ATP-dependent DNA ligase n=1 Tax=Xanthomonas oryzae TaxID=347 RepID=UPI0006AC217C|nr:ATP-dependent DNA ligase [Xanthomonas oryzae]KOR54414.1 ATP-dependent DNA ligase [Xanthomonas oryzae]